MKNVFKSTLNSMIDDALRAQVIKPILNSIFGGLGGLFGGGVSTSALQAAGMNVSPTASFAGGSFAKGGRPPKGRPSLVGERGAELFVPDTAGTIVPNNQLGGGQTINVTYAPQINALDPRTAATVIAENAPTIVGVIRQAFNRNGKAVAI